MPLRSCKLYQGDFYATYLRAFENLRVAEILRISFENQRDSLQGELKTQPIIYKREFINQVVLYEMPFQNLQIRCLILQTLIRDFIV